MSSTIEPSNSTLATAINDQNSSRKSKKKSIQQSDTSSNQSINKHFNNITNSATASGLTSKPVTLSKSEKKKASLENLLINRAIKSNQQVDKTATFITEATLNATLLRSNHSKSKSDLSLSSAKKQGKKQKTKGAVTTSAKSHKDELANTKLGKSLSSPVMSGNNNSNSSGVKKTSTTPLMVVTKKKDQPINSEPSNTKVKPTCGGDIRDRYWAYLFENLKRSVDEIFRTCENDNSISECKEVILILENCTNEFRSLAVKLLNEYEARLGSSDRPTSLAWELSKSSPPPQSLQSNFKSTRSRPPLQLEKSNNNTSNIEGFKDFLPEYINLSNESGTSSSGVNNGSGFDYQGDEDDEDLEYETNNPIDSVNHETFSDLQSINDTEDMSFNTLSITPPPPLPQMSQQQPQAQFSAPPNLPHPYLTLNQQQQQQQLAYTQIHNLNNQLQSLLMPQGVSSLPSSSTSSFANLTSQQITNIINKSLYGNGLMATAGGFNPPPSSLNNSISYHFGGGQSLLNNQSASVARPPSYPNYFLNHTELSSPFNGSTINQQYSNLTGFGMANNYSTNSDSPKTNGFNTTASNNNGGGGGSSKSFLNDPLFMNLNESFDNASMFDESFKLNLNTYLANAASDRNSHELIDAAELIKDDYDEEDENDFDLEEEDGFDEEEEAFVEDELEYRLQRQSKLNDMSNHHKSILKFYEEEEKNIAMEIRQDKQLLSVLAEEVKLTRQLSVEKLIHYNHQFQKLKNDLIDEDEHEENDRSNSKVSTDCDTNHTTERNTPLNGYIKNGHNQNSDSGNQDSTGGSGVGAHDDFEFENEPHARTPGRALHMHEKLLLLNRKTSPNERRRKHEEKQARAQEKREQFYQERLSKLRDLTKRIQEVSELKNKLLKAKKVSMKAKLERAEEKRQYLLRLKATKAAVEEQKAHEIAFINSLAAQNRKHDILEKHEKRQETIKQNLEEERLRKQEEQKAKEQAAELRRRTLESQRMAKLKEMLEKRRLKQSKIEQSQLEKEKERIETARAKEKTREMRLAIMEAQFQANKQLVKRRILQKQEEWSKRHEYNLEEIRKKAFEMSVLRFSSEDHQGDAPTPVPYDKSKYCSACNVVIGSEVQLKSHLRGVKHQQTMSEASQGRNLTKSEIEEYNLKCIVDISKEKDEQALSLSEERRKTMKKRLKKLKNKILTKGVEYENVKKNGSEQGGAKSKIGKLIKELEKHLNSNDKLTSSLDKQCSELSRAVQKPADFIIFRQVEGIATCVKLLETILSTSATSTQTTTTHDINPVSTKTSCTLITLVLNSIKHDQECACDLLMSNRVLSLVEILVVYSNAMLCDTSAFDSPTSQASSGNILINSQQNGQQKYPNEWVICSSLIQLLAVLFASLSGLNSESELTSGDLVQRGVDLISLITNYGLIDTLSVFFSNIRGPLDDEQQTAEILTNCLNFLIAITKFLAQNKKTADIFSERKADDPTQLISTFKSVNLVNIISMLYGMLHKDASTPVKGGQPGCGSTSSSTSLVTSNSAHIKKQPAITIELSILSLKLLNQMIVLDLNAMQSLLGEDSSSLQLRHIASYLLWYLSSIRHDELLHEIILLIGYFTVLNNENQINIELGTSPTIIQQLCNLPFNYFSDKKLISILFPTLICCCYNNEKNKSVLVSELSAEMLSNFIREKLNDKVNGLVDDKFDFSKRFPGKLRSSALEYFSTGSSEKC